MPNCSKLDTIDAINAANVAWEAWKNLTGKDEKVIKFVNKQKIFEVFFKKYIALFNSTASSFLKEGKKYLTIAFGCTGGIHRSVVMADIFYKTIDKTKFVAFIDHRDLKR